MLAQNLGWALAYHRAGWPIFPCWNKRPLAALLAPWSGSWTRVRDEGVTEAIIRDWWTKVPQAQIALACGKKSNIAVVDIDWIKDPETGWPLLDQSKEPESLALRWPTPLVSITGGKGRHLFFRNANVPNSAKTVHQQVDIRSEGGYVILPPSIHENGCCYEWDAEHAWSEEKLRSLSAFPNELIQNVNAPFSLKNEKWLPIVRGVTHGSRNISTAALAGCLIRKHDKHIAWELLAAWNAQNNRPPLQEKELLATFVSILKKHYANTSRND